MASSYAPSTFAPSTLVPSVFTPTAFVPATFAPAPFAPAPAARRGRSGPGVVSARHRSRAARVQLTAGPRNRFASHWQRQAAAPALLAAVLLLVAGIAAPERPADQAAICQRHNGVDACRVW